MPRYTDCSLYEEECRNGTCEHKTPSVAKQSTNKWKLWRSLSVTPNGVFVWDVLEVKSPNNWPATQLVLCRDGSYVTDVCFHHWTIKEAIDYFFNPSFTKRFDVIYITGKPELSLQEYKEWLKLNN